MQLSMETILENESKPVPGIRFTERDREILLFLFNMKFAEREDLHQKFFSRLQNGERSQSITYAAERISLLKKQNLLFAMKHPLKWSSILLPSLRAYYLISEMCPGEKITKPTRSYDLNTFSHDLKLVKLRLVLEEMLGLTDWISDRQLRATPELTGGLSGTYVPDAIYTTPSGEKVALELEISTKAKDRYREKVKRYVYLLRSSKEVKPFQRVQFICATEVVKRHLERETKLYPEYFSVEPLALYLPLKK